ncbi:hypothetical protein D9757_000998 [Collybiopsis confluens]|uniref:RNA helicase n=1 Tax=Collybiopsis confluens TaxID=2823264 RepID=A0A8H5I055_9AGAR|nr:hypothetical protein D9757_000998 [Collybiopsis confluens]
MKHKIFKIHASEPTDGPLRKKFKTRHENSDNLPWKTVSRPVESGLDGDDGILELEEVEGVSIIYEETDRGRVARFNANLLKKLGQVIDVDDDDDEVKLEKQAVVEIDNQDDTVFEEVSFDCPELLPEWHSYGLHPLLAKNLHQNAFLSPTPIQKAALPVALQHKDVIGVAQTGSGKTLAYGLPILHNLLSAAPKKPSSNHRPVKALVLAPTRELALQVSTHLSACLNPHEKVLKTEEESDSFDLKEIGKTNGKAKTIPPPKQLPPRVSVAAIVGGMSAQKQKRLLSRGADILVATPGRLWDIIEEDATLAKELKQLKFLVLDEADRMVEAGHFAELDNILRLTLRESEEEQIPNDIPSIPFGTDSPEPEQAEDSKDKVSRDSLQTFVFSATLSKDLQKNVKKRSKLKSKRSKKKEEKPASTLDDLLLRLDFRDPDPEVIDLSPVGGMVSTLTEGKIQCLSADKDAYIYYFLLRYPGRSLVFLSSIDGIRRLLPLTELLNIKAFPLHSQLEQRQRLKNLDRFKSTPNSVLLATDIAARGLDIPSVDHVIHYQIPRSADVYVHRNGRTARAMRKGFSMLMCAPDERKVVRALLANLGRNEDEIQEMTIDLSILDKLKARVKLARQIETTQHKANKAKHEEKWLREAAEAMEIELDEDFDSDNDSSKSHPSKRQQKINQAQTAVLKGQLKEMLAQPIMARGISARYITSGSRSIIDELVSGEYNDKMLGVGTGDADMDVEKKGAMKKRKEGKAKKAVGIVGKIEKEKEDEGEEEWAGILD